MFASDRHLKASSALAAEGDSITVQCQEGAVRFQHAMGQFDSPPEPSPILLIQKSL